MLRNYLIIFECVDMLSRENIYLRKILDLNLKAFGLRTWITLHFTGFWLEIFWTAICNYTYQIYNLLVLDLKKLGLRIWFTIITFYGIWTWNYLDCKFGFRMLFMDLDLKILGLQIRITIIRFYWIWAWKYLACDLGLLLNYYASS